MIDEKIQEEVLRHLYSAHFAGEDHPNLNEWAQGQGLDSNQVWSNFEILEEKELAEMVTVGGAGVTSRGILWTEKQNLVSEEQIRQNEQTRTSILDALSRFREEHGTSMLLDWEELIQQEGIGEAEFHHNIDVLVDAGLVRWIGHRELEITLEGLERVHEWRERVKWSEEFERLKVGEEFIPQQRGHELEKIIEQVLISDGWECERNVHAEGEEHDLIIHREREYYLVECKWEKEPIQPKYLRELIGRLTARIGVRGIFISMSGYTEAATKEGADRLESCIILLFGQKDIETVLNCENSFTDMLNEKFKAAVSRREIQVE